MTDHSAWSTTCYYHKIHFIVVLLTKICNQH